MVLLEEHLVVLEVLPAMVAETVEAEELNLLEALKVVEVLVKVLMAKVVAETELLTLMKKGDIPKLNMVMVLAVAAVGTAAAAVMVKVPKVKVVELLVVAADHHIFVQLPIVQLLLQIVPEMSKPKFPKYKGDNYVICNN